jgi:hypothetical protein
MQFFKIIETKYIGPTNSRGSRVKATDSNKNTITINWSSEFGLEQNHTNAALALLKKLADKNGDDETMKLIGYGSSISGSGYAFAAVRKL